MFIFHRSKSHTIWGQRERVEGVGFQTCLSTFLPAQRKNFHRFWATSKIKLKSVLTPYLDRLACSTAGINRWFRLWHRQGQTPSIMLHILIAVLIVLLCNWWWRWELVRTIPLSFQCPYVLFNWNPPIRYNSHQVIPDVMVRFPAVNHKHRTWVVISGLPSWGEQLLLLTGDNNESSACKPSGVLSNSKNESSNSIKHADKWNIELSTNSWSG